MFCLEADRGREAWTAEAQSSILSTPIFSEVDGISMLYFIESADGRLRQFDAFEGFQLWEFSCSEVNGVEDCEDSVEADFRYVTVEHFA